MKKKIEYIFDLSEVKLMLMDRCGIEPTIENAERYIVNVITNGNSISSFSLTKKI